MDRWPGAMRIALAAEYLDCSETEVERLIREGQLEPVQYNDRGMRRIPKEDLDAFIRQRQEKRISA